MRLMFRQIWNEKASILCHNVVYHLAKFIPCIHCPTCVHTHISLCVLLVLQNDAATDGDDSQLADFQTECLPLCTSITHHFIYLCAPTQCISSTLVYRQNTSSTCVYLHIVSSTGVHQHISSTCVYLHNISSTCVYLHIVSSTGVHQHISYTCVYLHNISSTCVYLHIVSSTCVYLHTVSSTGVHQHILSTWAYLHNIFANLRVLLVLGEAAAKDAHDVATSQQVFRQNGETSIVLCQQQQVATLPERKMLWTQEQIQRYYHCCTVSFCLHRWAVTDIPWHPNSCFST